MDKKPVLNRKDEDNNILSIIYSALKKASVVGIIYFAGYYNISIGWFVGPVVLFVLRDHWNKINERKRNVAKATALANEKDVVLACLDDLPSWVFFPDFDRAEWLNRIIKQIWPNVNHYARDLIRDTIQPTLRTRLEAYKLNGFKFERIILGTVPLRIGGILTYDKNIARNEIIMDLDVFYGGDCDISFSLGAIKGGIKDFQLRGMLRIVMKPLITTIPLVGGLQVYFLTNPDIDFNLVGIADLFDMPGLSNILKRIVCETIASIIVLPNKFPIKLSEEIDIMELKVTEPEGVLRIHIIEAKHLMKKDISMLGKGKSDPYAIITVGADEYKTKVINNTVDPKWDYWCEVAILSSEAQILSITLWDWDPGFMEKHDYLGRTTIDIENLVKKGQCDMWLTLEDVKHGMVHIRCTWLTLSKDYSDLGKALEETQLLRVTSMSTAVLSVFLDSAKNLPQARSSSKPDVYAVLRVGNNVQQTNIVMRSIHPVWEQGFTFLVTNPEADTLYLTVIDQKTNSEIGQISYNINSLSDKKNMEIYKEPFPLKKAGPESKIIWSLQLRILKTTPPQEDNNSDKILNRADSTVSMESTQSGSGNVQQSQEITENLLVMDDPSLVQEKMEKNEFSQISQTPSKGSSDEGLHRRSVSETSSAGEYGLGKIQLTFRYSVPRQRLIVVVHKIANIPLKDPSAIPDPYVKLYLLPERAKDSKRKTQVIKDNCNPIFDESFEYLISQADLNSKQLEITVCTQKQLFYSSSTVLGQVIIDFSKFNLTQPLNAWFDLKPE